MDWYYGRMAQKEDNRHDDDDDRGNGGTMVRQGVKYTSTLGIRENVSHRYTLERTVTAIETSVGPIRRKLSQGYGVTRAKYEFEDLARIAREKNLSLADVKETIKIQTKKR